MTENEAPELSDSEKAFKAFSPWLGAFAFAACMYYLLERNQGIPWYVFGICGGLMGLGKLMVAVAKGWKQ